MHTTPDEDHMVSTTMHTKGYLSTKKRERERGGGVKGQQPVAGRTWGDMSSLLSFFFHTSALSSPSSSDLQSSAMTASGHRTTSARAIVIAAIASIVVAREGGRGRESYRGGGREEEPAGPCYRGSAGKGQPASTAPVRRWSHCSTHVASRHAHAHAQTGAGGAAYQHQQQGDMFCTPASRVRCLVWSHATRQRGLHCSTGRRRGWGCVCACAVRTWWAGWWAA